MDRQSRDGPKHLTDTIDMLADTFDWWIPVASPFMIDEPFDSTLAQLRSIGWTGGFGGMQPAPRFGSMRVLSDVSMADEVTNPYLSYIPELLWKAGQEASDGQHRDIKRETIRIEYELQWTADRLNFTIKSRPSDRNYIVFLVIEGRAGLGKRPPYGGRPADQWPADLRAIEIFRLRVRSSRQDRQSHCQPDCEANPVCRGY